MLKMKFSKWTTIISCHVKNTHPCMHSVIAHTQHIFIFSHLCNLAHDLGGRLEAELVTSSVYEGVQGLTLGLAVEVK